uniref:Uncharacterized protein n=1 Tax=Oryza punctata TaxID=4537 RepID=A0A0E0KFI7_ORYPU
MKKVICFLGVGIDHLTPWKIKGHHCNPFCQPMVVGNSSSNFFGLQPAPTLVETNSGGRNMVNKLHESLLAPVLVVSVPTQKNASSD